MTGFPEIQSDRVYGRLWSLAWPVIGLNVLNVLALTVDTAMCGRLPDQESALTALGFATQVIFLLFVAAMGLTVGSIALIARAYGAGNHERVSHLMRQSTQLTVLVGIGVAIVGNAIAPLILRALGAEENIVSLALQYLRPLLTFTVFQYLMVLYAGMLRAVGNTRLPFLLALGANAVNVAVNYCLILGHFGFPALGLPGAAIGTICSHAFASMSMIFLLRRGAVPGVKLLLRPQAIDTGLAWELFRVGAPAALDMLILNASFLSIVGMLARVDPLAVAAHGVGLRVQALAFIPGMSVSQATGALVGQSLGARNEDAARAVTRASIVLCTAIMSVLAITFVLGVEPIVGIFKVDPGSGVGPFAVMWIRLLGLGMPIVGTHIALIGMLQGSGATNTSLGINFVGTVAFQIPLSALLGFVFHLGAFGIWLAFPLSFVIKAFLGILAYKYTGWARMGEAV